MILELEGVTHYPMRLFLQCMYIVRWNKHITLQKPENIFEISIKSPEVQKMQKYGKIHLYAFAYFDSCFTRKYFDSVFLVVNIKLDNVLMCVVNMNTIEDVLLLVLLV